jgi:CHAT domain-containing protein
MSSIRTRVLQRTNKALITALLFGFIGTALGQTVADGPKPPSAWKQIEKFRDDGDYEKAIAYAQKILPQLDKTSTEYAKTTYQLGRAYEDNNSYDKAEKELLSALDLFMRLKDELGVAQANNGLASLYEDLERYPEAERHVKLAISIYQNRAPHGPGMSAALVMKASIDIDQYLFSDADKELQDALSIDKSVWGEKDPEFGKTLSVMATLRRKTGNFKEAKDILVHVYELDKAAYGGEEYFEVSEDLFAIAELCRDIADYDCASANATKALKIDKQLFGDNDPSIADDLQQIASIASQKGDYRESERLDRDALRIDSRYYGADSVQAAADIYILASALTQAGQYSSALPLYKQVRAIDVGSYGITHRQTALDDYMIGTVYRNLGDYESAIDWLRKAIDADTVFYGPESYDVAADEMRLASIYSFKQDYETALTSALHATETMSKARGSSSPEYADALNSTASYLFRPEDFPRAVTMGERSLQIYEQVYGAHHPATFDRMKDVAQLYSQAAQFGQAERMARAALDGDTGFWGPVHAAVAADHERLGFIKRAEQNLPEATAELQLALTIRKKCFGETSWMVSKTMFYIGLYQYEAGDYISATNIVNSAVAIEQANGKRPFVGNLFNLLGVIYLVRNDLHNSEIYYRKALSVYSSSLSIRNGASILPLCNLGIVYRIRYEDRKALLLYNEALRIGRKISTSSVLNVYALLGLANLFITQGDVTTGRRYLLEAIELYKNKERTVEYAVATGALGSLYERERHYSEAAKYYQETLEVRLKILGPYHPSVATAYGNFASLYAEQRKYGEAIAAERQNAEILEDTIDSLVSMGSEEAKLQYVSLLSRQTWSTVSRFIEVSTPDAAKLVAETILTRKARALDATADILVGAPSGTSQTAELLAELRSERSKLAFLIFNDTANVSKGAVTNEGSTSVPRRDATPAGPRQDRGGLDRGLRDSSSGLLNERAKDSLSYRAVIEDTIRRIQSLESKLSEKKGRPKAGAVTLSSLQRALPDNSVLIEYFVFRKHYPYSLHGRYYSRERLGAYAITRNSDPILKDLGWLDDVTTEVLKFRQAIASRSAPSTRRYGRLLFGRLVNPFGVLLEGKERILISPDGSVGVLPFAALPLASGEYLLQKFKIAYFTAARDVIESGPQPEGRVSATAVVVADPAFSSPVIDSSGALLASQTRAGSSRRFMPSNLVFDRLAKTKDEGQKVCELLQCGNNLLMGTRATKAAVLELHSPVVLHVATHGFFLRPRNSTSLLFSIGADGAVVSLYGVPQANPMLESGLAFAGVNVPGQRASGILTALELSTVDLSGTQLIVLSACETGFGTDFGGEGILGLRRAIRLAGAKRQVTSLWKVNDRVTANLMTRFYQHFIKDRSHVDALQAAQLELLCVPETSDPYFWAAFVADGTWNPVEPNLLPVMQGQQHASR